jgi:inosine/xanthosine triphosphatase
MRVAIGSTNPTKVEAVKRVLGDNIELLQIEAPSFVSEQPFGDEETLKGALNRAKACLETAEVQFAIGLEGGVANTEYGLMVINWGALVDNSGKEYIASGARTVLPGEVDQEIQSGKTLGEAIDIYTRRKGVSKKEGAMGIITNGRINRDEMFAHVVKVLVGQYEFNKRDWDKSV